MRNPHRNLFPSFGLRWAGKCALIALALALSGCGDGRDVSLDPQERFSDVYHQHYVTSSSLQIWRDTWQNGSPVVLSTPVSERPNLIDTLPPGTRLFADKLLLVTEWQFIFPKDERFVLVRIENGPRAGQEYQVEDIDIFWDPRYQVDFEPHMTWAANPQILQPASEGSGP